MIELGKKARDKITGFEGVVIAKVTYLTGCDQYGLTPPAKDGKVNDTQYFDEGRIELIPDSPIVPNVTTKKPGGPNRDRPR
ncbi:MAG: hypothetical protein AB2806_08740 [Candidatus Thiodiazotropha sp.]